MNLESFEHDGDVDARPHGNCYWLARGRIIAGEYPRTLNEEDSRVKLRAVLDANVRHFIDLTEPHEGLLPYEPMLLEEAAARKAVVTWTRHAIRDGGVPSVTTMRKIISELRTPRDEVTYFHCWGGIGRTGTVAGCLLVELGSAPDAAIALIARKWKSMEKSGRRSESPETPEQFAYIRNWVRERCASPAARSCSGVPWH